MAINPGATNFFDFPVVIETDGHDDGYIQLGTNGPRVIPVNGDPNTLITTAVPAGSIALRYDATPLLYFTNDGTTWQAVGGSAEAVLTAFSTGWASGGEVTVTPGTFTLNVASGTGFINSGTSITAVSWGAGALTAPTDSDYHVYVDDTSTLQVSATEPSSTDNILLAAGTANGTQVVFCAPHVIDISQVATERHEYIEAVIGSTVVEGIVTSINGTDALSMDVTGGTYYQSSNLETLLSNNGITFTYWYRDGAGGWTQVLAQTQIDSTNYDNGTGVLAPLGILAPWKQDLLFVSYCPSSPTGASYHVIMAQQAYGTQALAAAGSLPAAPSLLNSFAVRTGGIVIQRIAAAIAEVVDQRSFLGQQAAGTTAATDHGALTGLLDDDHPFYSRADGTRAMTGNLDMGTNAIANVGNVDGRDVSADGAAADAHIADLANPHAVTAAQTAADPAGTALAGDAAHVAAFAHANLPTAGQKAALPGTGTPGAGDPYVNDSDARLSNTRELFFPATYAATNGDYAVMSIATNGDGSFTFFVPADFVSLTSLQLLLIPSVGAAQAARNIDLLSDYGASGQSATQHSESDLATTYNLAGLANAHTEIDASGVFSALAAGDRCGLHVDHNSVGGSISYLGIRMVYSVV